MQKWMTAFMVVSFCICTVVWAQENEPAEIQSSVPKVTPGDEYITEWLILGPFFPGKLDTDFLANIGGEASVRPKAGDAVKIQDGTTLVWKYYKSKTDIINLRDAVGDHENAVAYAFCILKSQDASESRMHIGSDDGIAVWINSERVYSHETSRSLQLDEDMREAKLKAGDNYCLVKVSQDIETWGFAMRVDTSPPNYAVLSGVVSDGAGRPVPQVYVRLEQGGKDVSRARTGESGSYRMEIFPASGQYDLYADRDIRGDLRAGIRLVEGQSRKFNLTLKNAVNITGKLLMLDGKTPHSAVIVQAVIANSNSSEERPVVGLSDENGKYRITNLKAGNYKVRCYTLDGYVYYKRGAYKAAGASDATALWIQPGRTTGAIDFRFAPFKKGIWKSYNSMNGLVNDEILTIYRDRDGTMWFGTGNGVSWYDGAEFTNLTRKDGLSNNRINDIYRDPDGVMWFGSFGRSLQYDSQKFASFSTQRGLAYDMITSMHSDPDGAVWFGSEVGVFRHNGGDFIDFAEADGLVANHVSAVHSTADGVMWFGTNKGASCYDSKTLFTYTIKDGLTHDSVQTVYSDPDGMLWLGTKNGISRYDGKEFVKFTTRSGLGDNTVSAIHRDPDGVMWFGTDDRGVFRYADRRFTNFTTSNGLAHNSVRAICSDANGVMWFATGGGVSRYADGKFDNFTIEKGLRYNEVWDIHCAPDNVIWCATGDQAGTQGGVSRYDGEKFVSFGTSEGLVLTRASDIYRDPDGVTWIGTDRGVFRYEGNKLTNLTTEDGLAHNSVRAICQDQDGVMWFATCGGGLSGYDGTAWTSLDVRDGLTDNCVHSICQDSKSGLWIATDKGAMLYRRSTTKPLIRIASVHDAENIYRDLSTLPDITVDQRVTIKYSAVDYRTIPEKRQYQYRVQAPGEKGMDSDWSKPTNLTSFNRIFRDTGKYTFEVRAIDRDLKYSDPASLPLDISAPIFYRTDIFLLALTILGGGALIILIFLGVRQHRSSHTKKLRLQKEMEEARKMQDDLLPKAAPFVKNFDIAGLSKPAQEVGGDFFDYLPLPDGETGIALSGTTVKGLKGATSAVLTKQTLRQLAQSAGSSCGELLSELNTQVYSQLEKQEYIVIGFATFKQDGKILQWSNAGQPHPIIKRRQDSFEVKGNNVPLGIVQNSVYTDWEIELQAGDAIIFYTDGIIEARNKAQEIYGIEQLKKVVADINPVTDAKGIIWAVLRDVTDFIGDTKQHDDMTIVVVKKALRAR